MITSTVGKVAVETERGRFEGSHTTAICVSDFHFWLGADRLKCLVFTMLSLQLVLTLAPPPPPLLDVAMSLAQKGWGWGGRGYSTDILKCLSVRDKRLLHPGIKTQAWQSQPGEDWLKVAALNSSLGRHQYSPPRCWGLPVQPDGEMFLSLIAQLERAGNRKASLKQRAAESSVAMGEGSRPSVREFP